MKDNAITFDEIMSYHSPDNQRIFNDILGRMQTYSIVPFIGAGLSAFAYKPWTSFLYGINAKLYSDDKKDQFVKLMASCRYEEAASLLEKERGKANFIDDLKDEFTEEKLNTDDVRKRLYQQAVYLVPLLFSGLVLTTNFDRVLEQVYKQHLQNFVGGIGHPGHYEMLNTAMRKHDNQTLYKFHGDISEPGQLVLTKEKYDEHYAVGSVLFKELCQCFAQKSLLFLGCSLHQDRTMSVLSHVLEDGMTDYAIVDCAETKRGDRARELGDKGIRALLYPEGKYEAVRVIFERLLEIMNKKAYDGLGYYIGKTPSPSQDRFKYDSDFVRFFGRDAEIEALKTFCCADERAVEWWAITGEGGSGKSRLAYEFMKIIAAAHWDVKTPACDYQGLCEASDSITRKTLFILDYVQYFAKDIGKWIEGLNRSHGTIKKRILLIEREGTGRKDAAWAGQLEYDAVSSLSIKETSYKEDFLKLQPLERNDIQDIMKDYAAKLGKALEDTTTNQLYEQLQQIDPDLCRPLYSLFLIDAYLENKDALNWNREEILDYVTDKEIKIYRNRMRKAIEGCNKKIEDAFLKLKAMATVLDGLEIPAEAALVCKDDWDVICAKADRAVAEPQDMLYSAGLLERTSDGWCVPPLQPDIIGGYYVFRLLSVMKDEQLKAFIKEASRMPIQAVMFYDRLFRDHMNLLRDNERIAKSIITQPDIKTEDYVIFAFLLVNISSYSNGEIAKDAVNVLEALTDAHTDIPEVIIEYTNGLFNLTTKQDEAGRKEALAKLEALAEAHADIPDVIIAYANGLFNLTTKQDEAGGKEALAKLEALAEAHTDIPEVIIRYAQGLVNLTFKQDEAGIKETVAKLEALAGTYADIPGVIIQYAEGLFNLVVAQDEAGRKETVRKLETLEQAHADVRDVTIRYAQGLFSFTFVQDEAGRVEAVEKLEALAKAHADMPDVITRYAKGLVNLTYRQGEAGIKETVAKLETLTEAYADIPGVVIAYAEALFKLAFEQDEGLKETVEKLEALANAHADIPGVIIKYANGLNILTFEQDEAGIKETVEKLEALAKEHADMSGVIIIYAKGLVSLTAEQDEAGRKETVEKLEALAEAHADIPGVIIGYAKGLVNLIAMQDEAGRKETVEKLEALADAHRDLPDILEISADAKERARLYKAIHIDDL